MLLQKVSCYEITCIQVDILEPKGNPERFGKQEDGAAGWRDQVEIELYHVGE